MILTRPYLNELLLFFEYSCRQGKVTIQSYLELSKVPSVKRRNVVSCSMGRSSSHIYTPILSIPPLTKLSRSHYDVISAPSNGWTSDPFTLSGRNGYLYGRGSTDNKGPIIAVACAAADLLSRRALEVDLVFLIEGEEEHGSLGFKDAVRQNKVAFFPVSIWDELLFLTDLDLVGSNRRNRCDPCQVGGT